MSRVVGVWLAVCLGGLFSLESRALNHDSVASTLESNDTLSADYKATEYRKLAEQFLSKDTLLFDRYINLSMQYAREAGNFIEQGYNFLGRANHCYFIGDLEGAKFYFRRVGSVSDTLEDPWFRLVKYNGVGIIHYTQSNMDSALHYYLQAEHVALESGDSSNGIAILINMGGILRNIELSDSAFTVYQKALTLSKQIGKKSTQMQANVNLANISILRSDYARALQYASTALRQSLLVQDPYYLAESRKVYAQSLLWVDSLNKARKSIKAAMAYFQGAGDVHGESDAYRTLALLLAKAGEPDSSFAGLKRSRELDSTSQNRLLNQQTRSRIYELSGNHERSLEAYKLYKAIYDSLINEKSLKGLNEIREKYESEKKQRQIAEQNEELKQKELDLSRKNTVIGFIVSIFIILTVLVWIYFERKKRKFQTEKDALIIAEREKGLEAILMAQEEERRRIGADLHDGITQSLGAVSLQLQHFSEKLGSEKDQKVLLSINEILEQSISEVREISHQMRPYALDNLGLTRALELLLENSLKYSSIGYSFEELNTLDRYDKKIEVAFYRVAQELLNNTIKHSGATEVVLQLIDTKKFLIMILEDNGKGLTPEEQSNGQGLLNIRSRLNSLHGDVDLDPSKQAGTSVVIRIPLA